MKNKFGAVALVGGLFALLCPDSASAELRFGSPFSDGVVLQREKPVAVWGWTDPGQQVSVAFGKEKVTCRAGDDGRWDVTIGPFEASKDGRVLTAENEKGERISVSDVVVGEVWFVAGQSNAQMPLWYGYVRYRDCNGALVARMSNNANLRFCHASNFKWAVRPKEVAAYEVKWKRFSPENLETDPSFSAMAVYFARELYLALDIPIGLIGTYWGGTNIDAWIPKCGYDKRPDLDDMRNWPTVDEKHWDRAKMEKAPIYDGWQQPSVIFNEMVSPWVPMTVRGVLWYQGCHNAGDGEWERYCSKLHALYDGWSLEFKNPELDFLFVQLVPWGNANIAMIQQQQAKFEEEEPHAAMVVAGDYANLHDIHPNQKATIGLRLAALALKRDYGRESLTAESPKLESWKIANGAFELSFANAKDFWLYNDDHSKNTRFEVCGENGIWYPAEIENYSDWKMWDGRIVRPGTINGNRLIIRSKKVPNPVRLRYLYSKPWTPNLFSDACLPLGPFHIGEESKPYERSSIFEDGGFFVGCNYWAKNAGMMMWRDFNPKIIDEEFAALASNGSTVLRVFPLWSDFQPLVEFSGYAGESRGYGYKGQCVVGDGVDPEMLERFRTLCDLAAKHDLKLIVGLVTGWMSGRLFVPPAFERKNVITDGDALMWQVRFVRRFVRELKDHPAITSWDLGNECNCLAEVKQGEFWCWMNQIASAIRLEDAARPVVSGMHSLSTSESAMAPIRQNGEICDVLCTHPYSFYVPGCGKEAFDTMRTELHPTAESVLYRDLGGRPCFIEEIGNLGTSCNSDESTAAGMRVALFSAWANDLKGCLWWCNSDQESLEFPPYVWTANERELGMFRQDMTPKPVMLEMKAFQEFRRSLPFKRLPKARTDAVIIVPEKDAGWIPAFGCYLLSRQAGFNPAFAGAERELPDSQFYILCSSERDESYTYTAQKRLIEKVRAGATVLILYCGDSRLTHLRGSAGVKVENCMRSPVVREFTLGAYPSRKILCADKSTARLSDGEAKVLGRTTDGEPAFTEFQLGKGKVLLCNSPIDRASVERTDAFAGDKIVPYYLVFREAARLAGLRHVVEKADCPSVVLTEHPTPEENTIVIALNCEPRAVTCPVTIGGRLRRIWRGDVAPDQIRLSANEAAVFEVEKMEE